MAIKVTKTKKSTRAKKGKGNLSFISKLKSVIVGDDFDNNEKFRSKQLKSAEIITLKTKTLSEILIENNAPTEMDYLSLDIEGGEYEALKNFDFKKYKWK